MSGSKTHAVVDSNGRVQRFIHGQAGKTRLSDGEQILNPGDVDMAKLQTAGKMVDLDTMTVVDDPNASTPFDPDALATDLRDGNVTEREALLTLLEEM
jgi:hypothetical protein